MAGLARLLPDEPRWVETKYLLLFPESELLGFDRAINPSYVICNRKLELASVVGCPPTEAIELAARQIGSDGVLLCPIDSRSHVAKALPQWTSEPAVLHILEHSSRLSSISDKDVRFVNRDELTAASLPDDLKGELVFACDESPIAAAFSDGKPVSFCYAGSQTEKWWDISIDTLEGHRKKGLAQLCVSFFISHMRQFGKEPIWGAMESNIASLRLAAKLGFVEVDEIIVFEPQPAQLDIPIIDISSLIDRSDRQGVAERIAFACREYGFFYVTGHGIDEELQDRLVRVSRAFFDQDLDTKLEIRMARGGRAWRGYFPVGEELTSAVPDQKEGIYFGTELDPDDPRVRAGLPMHGSNLFPLGISGLRSTVLSYIEELTALGHDLVAAISLSLGREESFFNDHYTADPLILFRIFNYPSIHDRSAWGVGEHTDYGLLTILKQDEAGGLEIKVGSQWIQAPAVPGSFICNIGDMLDRMTAGRYRSTPHRVRNTSGRDRLSFAFFFDPNFDAEIHPLFEREKPDDKEERWDQSSVREFRGTYGDYLLNKVSKVFPDLKESLNGERGQR